MSAAVVHRPRAILPKFNFLLAGSAIVLSIIAITDNVGSKSVTATPTKPAAVATATAVAAKAPAVARRLVANLSPHEIGAKVTASQPSIGRLMNDVGAATSQPSVGRLLNDVGPVQAAGTCGFKVGTTC